MSEQTIELDFDKRISHKAITVCDYSGTGRDWLWGRSLSLDMIHIVCKLRWNKYVVTIYWNGDLVYKLINYKDCPELQGQVEVRRLDIEGWYEKLNELYQVIEKARLS